MPTRVLVIGAGGFFGRRLVQRLLLLPDVELLTPVRGDLDAMHPGFAAALARLAPQIVVNTAGPFQGQDHRVPLACIAAKAHCIDLADARDYVTGIRALDDEAKSAGVLVASGASSVPALSTAVCDELARGLTQVDTIDIGISPGNRTERGLATVRSVLSYCGRALPNGQAGWSTTWRHDYPAPVGTRLLSPCDVPDLALLPARYPGSPRVRFGAGLELRFLHRGMNALAWAVRHCFVGDASRYARPLKWMADRFMHWGSDAGAMHVSVAGAGVVCTWQLVATHGDGPFVPTLAAAALVRRLAAGEIALRGAMPCVGLLSLQDFARAAQGLHITMGPLA
jgi:hypothetical protein